MVKRSYINRIHRNAASLKTQDIKQPASESTPKRKTGLSIRSNPIFRLFTGGKKKSDGTPSIAVNDESTVTHTHRIRVKIEECPQSPNEQEERYDRIEAQRQNSVCEERENATKDTHPSNEDKVREVTRHEMNHSSIDMTGAVASPNYKKSALKRPKSQRRKKKSLGFENSQQQWVYFPNNKSGSSDQGVDEVSVLASDAGEASVEVKYERGAAAAAAAKKRVTYNEDIESSWAGGLYSQLSGRMSPWNIMRSTESDGSASTVTYQWDGVGNEDSASGDSCSNCGSESRSGGGSRSGSGSFYSDDDNSSSGTPTDGVVNIHLPEQSLMSRILQSQDDQIQLQAKEIKRLKRKEKEQQIKHLRVQQEAKRLLDEYEAAIAKMAEKESQQRKSFRNSALRIGSSSRSVASTKTKSSRSSGVSKSSVFKLKSLLPGRNE